MGLEREGGKTGIRRRDKYLQRIVNVEEIGKRNWDWEEKGREWEAGLEIKRGGKCLLRIVNVEEIGRGM